jgi:hypothetical protein
MSVSRSFGPFHGVLLISLLAAATGCGSNSTDASKSSSVSSANTTSASTAAGSEMATTVASMMTSQSASANTSAIVRGSGIRAEGLLGAKTLGCGTVVVNATDGGGDPTDETITYALPACEYTGIWGQDSLSLTGTLELALTDGTGFSFKSTATNLALSFTKSGATSTETRNGSRQITASATSASIANNITTAFSNAAGQKGTFTNDLTVSFTPVSGSELVAGQPLPNGTVQANGTVAWQGTSNTDNFTVTTVAPLVYDASCVPGSASPFDSGALKVAVVANGSTAYGKVTWSNCGAPTVVVY